MQFYMGLPALLLAVFVAGDPQQNEAKDSGSAPFTAFGSEAHQRQRQRLKERQQQPQGRFIGAPVSFGPSTQFQFRPGQFATQQQASATPTFRQSPFPLFGRPLKAGGSQVFIARQNPFTPPEQLQQNGFSFQQPSSVFGSQSQQQPNSFPFRPLQLTPSSSFTRPSQQPSSSPPPQRSQPTSSVSQQSQPSSSIPQRNQPSPSLFPPENQQPSPFSRPPFPGQNRLSSASFPRQQQSSAVIPSSQQTRPAGPGRAQPPPSSRPATNVQNFNGVSTPPLRDGSRQQAEAEGDVVAVPTDPPSVPTQIPPVPLRVRPFTLFRTVTSTTPRDNERDVTLRSNEVTVFDEAPEDTPLRSNSRFSPPDTHTPTRLEPVSGGGFFGGNAFEATAFTGDILKESTTTSPGTVSNQSFSVFSDSDTEQETTTAQPPDYFSDYGQDDFSDYSNGVIDGDLGEDSERSEVFPLAANDSFVDSTDAPAPESTEASFFEPTDSPAIEATAVTGTEAAVTEPASTISAVPSVLEVTQLPGLPDDGQLQELDPGTDPNSVPPTTTAAPLPATETSRSAEDSLTSVTPPPSNRVTRRDTTPVLARPTRPSFTRRGFPIRTKPRRRPAEPRESKPEVTESPEEEPVEVATEATVEREEAGVRRRLSFRDRLNSRRTLEPATTEPPTTQAPELESDPPRRFGPSSRRTLEPATTEPPTTQAPELESDPPRRFRPSSRRTLEPATTEPPTTQAPELESEPSRRLTPDSRRTLEPRTTESPTTQAPDPEPKPPRRFPFRNRPIGTTAEPILSEETPTDAPADDSPAKTDEEPSSVNASPRRLSLRERLRQKVLQKVGNPPNSDAAEEGEEEEVATTTETPTVITSTTTTATTTTTTTTEAPVSTSSTEKLSSERAPLTTRRPRPSGGRTGGLASLLIAQLQESDSATAEDSGKEEEVAVTTEPSPTTTTSTTASLTTEKSTISTTTAPVDTASTASTATAISTASPEPTQPSKTDQRGGLAGILSQATTERSTPSGLSSLIERLRSRTSTTEPNFLDEPREGKSLTSGSPFQDPDRSTGEKQTSSTSSTSTTTTTTTEKTGIDKDDLSRFLPPGFKPVDVKTEVATTKAPEDVVIVEEDINPEVLPNDFKEKMKQEMIDLPDEPKLTPPPVTSTTTVKPQLSVEDVQDLSAFLPPGFKLDSVSTISSDGNETSQKMPVIEDGDVSAFLPPGYELSSSTEQVSTEKSKGGLSGLVVEEEDVSAFLPPGYKLSTTTKSTTTEKARIRPPIIIEDEDVSAFLPPGYKLSTTTEKSLVIEDEDVSAFLPKDYKPQQSSDSEQEVPSTTPLPTTKKRPGLVFPTRPGGAAPPLLTIEDSPVGTEKTPSIPPLEYNVSGSDGGLFSRLGDRPAFTGWPTDPTEPTTVSPAEPDATPSAAPSTTTTEVTTTHSTTRRPLTTPGTCPAGCRMAGTIRVVDGLRWRPEMAIRGTKEWADAADLVTLELTEAFRNSPLAVWFDRVEIEAFSEGSVMVDYYLIFNELVGELNTQDVRVLFQEKLPALQEQEQEQESPEKLLQLGSLAIDPGYTDFVVQRAVPVTVQEADNYLIPEWLIAVIVIGLTALLFMLIFGIVVMWNRRKRRRAPRTALPLTADVLNELDKSHMAGLDNYGADPDVYDPDEAWDNEKVTYMRRLRPSSREKNMDIHNYNIYDSWRSDMSVPRGGGSRSGYSGRAYPDHRGYPAHHGYDDHGPAAGWSRGKVDNFDDDDDPDDF